MNRNNWHSISLVSVFRGGGADVADAIESPREHVAPPAAATHTAAAPRRYLRVNFERPHVLYTQYTRDCCTVCKFMLYLLYNVCAVFVLLHCTIRV